MFRREAHAAWLIRALTLGLLAVTLPLTTRGLYGPPGALVNVRWQPSVDGAERQRIERGLLLVDGLEVSRPGYFVHPRRMRPAYAALR